MRKAKYIIEILDPKSGTATHIPFVDNGSGFRRLKTTPPPPPPVKKSEEQTYQDSRTDFSFKNLDFHTAKDRITKLIFKIDSNSDYTFADIPLIVGPGDNTEAWMYGKRNNAKEAEVDIPGHPTVGNERKYTLLYFDKNGDPHVHDPIILNGENDPAPPI